MQLQGLRKSPPRPMPLRIHLYATACSLFHLFHREGNFPVAFNQKVTVGKSIIPKADTVGTVF